MTGTSVDGIDIAIIECSSETDWKLIDAKEKSSHSPLNAINTHLTLYRHRHRLYVIWHRLCDLIDEWIVRKRSTSSVETQFELITFLNLSKLFPFEESLQVSHAISGIPQHSNQTTVKFVGNFAGFWLKIYILVGSVGTDQQWTKNRWWNCCIGGRLWSSHFPSSFEIHRRNWC